MADQDRYPPLSADVINPVTKKASDIWNRWFRQMGATPMIYRGTRAEQGRVVPVRHSLYVVTDEGALEQWDGTAWQTVLASLL
jgi:hypothetical protein